MKKNLALLLSILICGTLFSFNRELPIVTKVMVFAPHPDDDILGCGGAIIQHVRDGAEVIVVYVTSGEAAKWPGGPEELAHLREEEARRGQAILGVSHLIFLREPDSKCSSLEKIDDVVSLFQMHQPELIYIPHKHDGHPDHRATHELVVNSVQRLFTQDSVLEIPEILAYEVWTPMEHITHECDLSDDIEVKIEALKEHKTQIAYLDFVDAIRALNRYRGLMRCGTVYGECFQKVKC